MSRRSREWLLRGALLALGCVAALALVELVLRTAAGVYERRQQTAGVAPLEPRKTYRVLCLGESTTAGLGQGEDAYPSQLQAILNAKAAGEAAFRVINGGMIATTSDVILARLPDNLEKLDPHLVVAMIGINDGSLIDPGFQVGGRLRVWKLVKMLYYKWRRDDPSESAEGLTERAGFVLRSAPAVAVSMAERAAELAPGDPRPKLIMAAARARLGEPETARQLYAQVLATDPVAVVAHSFDADDKLKGPLEAALAQFPEDANALAARALLVLRDERIGGALILAGQATTADSNNVVALVIEGNALLAAGRAEEARHRYRRAMDSDAQLAGALAAIPATRTPLLSDVAGSDPGAFVATGADDSRRWILRSAENLSAGFVGLRLQAASQIIARGDVEKATRELEELAATYDPKRANLRLSALGQLAILEWQAGNRRTAEAYHREIEDFLAVVDNPSTRRNYRAILALLRERGIPLVAVQYPMRRLKPLEKLLDWPSDVAFVDNESVFKEALLGRAATEIFSDLFAGDFGHLTPLGNRILAENIAGVILDLAGQKSAAAADTAS